MVRRLACVLLAVAALARADGGEPLRLVVLHTNDIHGQLSPHPPSPVRAVLRGKAAGGFAHLASMVRAIRRECAARDVPVLLLDAGDLFQGTPIGNETRGAAVVAAMNALRYDAAAVGNHEFDFGFANFQARAEQARFPFLCANLSGGKGAPPWRKAIVLAPPRTPCRVALIGALTPKAARLLRRGALGKRRVRPAPDALRPVLAGVAADVRIVVSHLGHEDDAALARACPSIDLVVGGHSHRPTDTRVGSTLIVQTHAKTLSLGRVDVEIDPATKRVRSMRARLLPVDPAATPADPAVAAVIDTYGRDLARRLAEVVGKLAAPARRRPGLQSSPAGNWMADVTRAAAEAEIGFMNKGGIRCDLEPGPVTRGDVYRLMPFENTVVAMELTGAQIRAIVAKHVANGGYPALEWSGIAVDVHPGPPPRLVSIRTESTPLDPRRRYRVAVNSFLAGGGDGFTGFRAGRARRDTGLLMRDALARDLAARSPVTPPAGARLRVREPAR